MKLHQVLHKLITVSLVFFIDGAILKFVWNRVITSLFHLDSLTYANALFLMIAVGILFHPKKADKDLEKELE